MDRGAPEAAEMQMQLDILAKQVLRASYRGPTTIAERREAKGTIGAAAEAGNLSRIIIDLRHAEQTPYAPVDAIAVVSRVLESPAFGRLAYLVDPDSRDAVADFLSQYDPHFCQVFHDQESATRWLSAA
jgi:hypothetical protein